VKITNLTLSVTIDIAQHKVERYSFTQREFEFDYLIKNKGKVCTRTQIIEDVWDIHFEYDTGVIDVL
jgi:DNA-binding response OmpR family regulator